MTTTPTRSVMRGAIPSPRSALSAATPYVAVAAPPNFIIIPKRISMWGNDVHGDCAAAEEAFAKACNNPEIFISYNEVITWATNHSGGFKLVDVLHCMQTDGFFQDGKLYNDGHCFPSIGQIRRHCKASSTKDLLSFALLQIK